MQINQILIHAYSLSQMSIIRNVYWLNNTLYPSEKSLFVVVWSRKIFTDEYYPSGYFPRTGTIHPGIFLGLALWADSVSPRMKTIASRDQFKPIRIGENLVVNYKNVYTRAFL